SLLSHISLLTLSVIAAKIDSDWKRKKSPVVLAEQKEKHKLDLNKTKKMSYFGNSHGGDGAEVRASHILVKHEEKIDSDRKRTKSPVVLVEKKEKHKHHLNRTNKMSFCGGSDGRDGGSQLEDIGTKAAGYNRVVEENGKLFIMIQIIGDIRVYCRIRHTSQAESKNIIDFIGEDGSVFSSYPSKILKHGREVFHFSRSGPLGCTYKDMGINYVPLNYLFRFGRKVKVLVMVDYWLKFFGLNHLSTFNP
ncbi:hypothetical protein S245_016072, partial [Arachis hypogaea]